MAIDTGKVSKNQTAVQRAVAAQAGTGKRCEKCGEDIKLKDLVNVKQIDHATGRKVTAAYHRACYGF